ncbi:MAG: hypothetical protein V1789_03170 [PVC group bacterium]
MMKALCAASVIVIALLISVPAGAEEETGPPDFRQARWGMSPDEVKKTETEARQSGEMPELLLYEGDIAGVRASIFYLFDQGKLARGICTVEPPGQDAVMDDYEGIRAYLLKEYGEPAEEELNLKEEAVGDLDPADPGDRYQLVLRKAMGPLTVWTSGRTRIYLQLTEKDSRVAIHIGYFPLTRFMTTSGEF